MMRIYLARYFSVHNTMFASLISFVKRHINLTFTLLGVLIFVVLISSLISGINFAVANIKTAFEVGEHEAAPMPHFDFSGFAELGFPVH